MKDTPAALHSEVTTPPPFNPPADSDAVAALGLSEEQTAAVRELLLNADAQGYLRGRNEHIEATTVGDLAPESETEREPVFPIYNRRSVWD